MDNVVLLSAFLIVTSAYVYYQYRKRRLQTVREQQRQPVKACTSFDYASIREKAERTDKLLKAYDSVTNLLEDLKISEDDSVEISFEWLTYSGDKSTADKVPVNRKLMQQFTKIVQESLKSSLSKDD